MSQPDLDTPPRLTPFAISYSVIVAILLLLFYFGVVALSGVRGFVGGESSWSKAEKQAAACLQRYAVERDEVEFACYTRHRELLLAARNAREELQKKNPDMQAAYEYLVRADADPDDVRAMATVFRVLGRHPLMKKVIGYWESGDVEVATMDSVAMQMRFLIGQGVTHDNPEMGRLLMLVREGDGRLTQLEDGFSKSLGEGARYIRRMMLISIIITAVLLLGVALYTSSRWIVAWGLTQRLASVRAGRMRAVAAAAAGVGGVSTIEELDVVLREAISKVIDADMCTFGMYDAATHSFTFLPGVADGRMVPSMTVDARGTPSERFLTERSSLLTATSADPTGRGAVPHGGSRMSESVIRSPMYSESRLLGVLAVHSYTPDKYTRDDVEVIETLASVAASAVGRIESTRERHVAEEGLRRSEEQLAQAQKMEAVGLLAGGVAHDFNNLLTAIKGNSSLLAEDDALPDSLREHVDEIAAASDRAAALTRQLLAFSRRQVLQPRVVDLNALVLNMTSLIRRLIGEDVELLTSLDHDLGRVRADPHQLEQVILNLSLNARDAMSQRGSMVVETANVELTEAADNMPHIVAGSYVRLSVQDTGIGMSEESRDRIFEPFFTTKGVGKGTGLGLSTVYGIVKQSGGYIYVDSAPGMGTTMQIFLPRTNDPLDPPLKVSTPRAAVVPVQRATVMVVEDEATVRTLLSRVLTREGYTVVEAGSGEEAMAILQGGIDIDLILTDTVMPGISGVELAREALRLRPSLAILHMSGYTDDEVFRRGLSGRGDAFLQKPFPPDVLVAGVAEALGRRGSGRQQ